MNTTSLQKIIMEHAKKLEKNINIRVVVLIDPASKNPYDSLLGVYAPGIMHISTEKLTDLIREFRLDTDKFLEGIISKEESKIPRSIYVSTTIRRIFLRHISIPNKKYELVDPLNRYKIPKDFSYCLGISVVKDLSHVGKEMPEEKPQAIFDEMDVIIKDLKNLL